MKTEQEKKIEAIAEVCHGVNRAYCEAIGDYSQTSWDAAPDWQQESAVKGVQAIAAGVVRGPGDSHRSWLKEKEETGWKYGPAKDPANKEHPCMVPFEDLPEEQQLKDVLFFQTARALLGLESEPGNKVRDDVRPRALTSDEEAGLRRAFTYHPPSGDQPVRYNSLRSIAHGFAEAVLMYSSPSRERSLALTKIEEAVMWANAGIARNG